MNIIERIRDLFSGKQSGAEGATTGGAVAATARDDDPAGSVESQSGSGWSGGGESGGDGGGSGGGAG